MSKGERLVSAKTETMKTTHATNIGANESRRPNTAVAPLRPGTSKPNAFHGHGQGPCRSTISFSSSVPATSTTQRTDSVSASSYEIICAEERMAPSSEYFEPDDQPPSTRPYTPSEASA